MELLPCFTIDGPTSRDLDDALWIEMAPGGGVRLFVHITNVAAHLDPAHPSFEMAAERVATRYHPAGNTLMLPRSISEQNASLLPFSSREAITVEIDVTSAGDVERTRVYPSTILSRAKLTYAQVPEILTDTTAKLHPRVKLLSELALTLLARRRAHGALALYDLHNGWVSTEEGWLKRVDHDDATVGYVIVQETMILANEAFARFAIANDIPILYRNHTARAAAPDRAVLRQQIDLAMMGPVQGIERVREQTSLLLNRASYGASVLGHYGLNLPVYTHMTSPIRRFADLVTQQQMFAFLKGEPFPHTPEAIAAYGQRINDKLAADRAASEARWRERAAQNAEQALEAQSFDGLNEVDFSRMVRIAIHAGREADDVLRGSIQRRMTAGRLPFLTQALILGSTTALAGWEESRRSILADLPSRAHDAWTLLLLLSIHCKWSKPSAHCEEGPAGGFFVTTQVNDATGRPWRTHGHDTSKKGAQQAAAVKLLREVAGGGAGGESGNGKVVAAAPPLPPKVAVIDTAKDPVMALYEYAQGLGIAQPSADFDMAGGPDHAPVFVCVMRVAGRSAEGRAGAKKDAKREAARALVQMLAAKKSEESAAA